MSKMIRCSFCHHDNPSGEVRCKYCGRPLAGTPISTPSPKIAPKLPPRTVSIRPTASIPSLKPSSSISKYLASLVSSLSSFTSGLVTSAPNPPDIEGEIIDIYTRNVRRAPDIAGCLLFGFFALILLIIALPIGISLAISGLAMSRPREMHEIQFLRVETGSKKVCEARIDRELRGGGVRLGDRISLWGQYEGSILVVNRGYNHFSSADIRLASSIEMNQVIKWLVLALILLGILQLCTFIASFPLIPF